MEVVNAHRGSVSCPEIDDRAVLVHQIELRAKADATDNAVQGLLNCGRPDVWRSLLHIDADEFLAGPGDGLRNLVFRKGS